MRRLLVYRSFQEASIELLVDCVGRDLFFRQEPVKEPAIHEEIENPRVAPFGVLSW